MSQQKKWNEKDLLCLVESHIMHTLANGAWHKVTDLRKVVPEDLADARAGLSGEGSYCDIGRVNFGRLSLVHGVIMSLRQHDKCETRNTGDQEEIRLIGIPCSEMNAAAHGDATTSLPLVSSAATTSPATTVTTPAPTSPSVPLPPGPAMVPIDEIIVGDRYRTDLGDIDALARSIELLGLLHPPVILSDRRLVAGWRRQEALKRLGRSAIPVNVVSNLDDALLLLEAERDENTCRKDFSKTEAVALGMAIEAIEREQAKLRQRHHGGTAPGRTKNTSGNLPEVSAGTTRDKAAEVVGMSPRTYDKAKQVVEAAEKEPEKFGDLPAAMNQFDKVDPAFQELKRRQGSEVPAASKGDSKSAKLDVPSCESDETTGAVGNATDGIANNAVTLKLSSTPAAMARALVKALGQKKALQLVQALERAISTQKGGQPRQRPRNSKTKVKKRTGQKRKLDRLPMTKPRRPVQVVDPMYFG